MSRVPGAAMLPLLLCAALAGCANLRTPAFYPPAVRPAPTTIAAFDLAGRISLRRGQTRYIASLSWQHDAAHDDILLSGPFGQGLGELSRDATGARLLTADGQRIEAADWEGLALQAFGAELPLAMLVRWLVADAPADATRDAAGRALAFARDGWSVSYDSYESEAPAALPSAIAIRREDIELHLKVDAWAGVR